MTRTGCFKCWARDTADTWHIVASVPIEAYLVDEQHFIVSVRVCNGCSQQYLQVTTETIDWLDGDDSACRTVIPIDAGERAMLEADQPITRAMLERVGPERRSLRCDAAKGDKERVYSGTGMHVGSHD